MATNIHPTAIIDPGAHIGVDCKIGPYTIIENDVIIEDRCDVGPHCQIAEGTRIGADSRIFNGAALGLIPQDKKFSDEKTFLHIGKNAFIREFVTINRGTEARGETRIGDNSWIMAYCHIAHDCILGNNVTISNNLAMAGHVEVGNFVTIGGIVPIHQFTRIGDYAMIGSTARPFMDVVPFALVGPEPTRIVGVNKVGLERRGFSDERRKNIDRAYKILFRKGLSLQDALLELEKSFQGQEDIENLISFIKKSDRGILRMNVD